MTNWANHKELQDALTAYLAKRGLILDGRETYASGIDCVFVSIHDKPVFIIGLPPVSNYRVRETENTTKYLKQAAVV